MKLHIQLLAVFCLSSMLNIEDLIKQYFPSVQTRTFSRAHRYDLYEWRSQGYIPYRELFLNRVMAFSLFR